MDSDDAAHALTTGSVAALARAAGIEIDPDRLPAVVGVLAELFALEREIEAVDAALPGEDGDRTGART